MNGVMSLMQPQGQQGPMPGQAQQQPMQGMMPRQGAPTPGAMTASLKSMPLDQLKMLFQNPQPNSPPLWAVISALAEKQKEAQAMQASQGQQAMAQNAQMQQQPPVAAQVMQSAEQMQEPVMAAYGGEMHGYAGGGSVAFRHGGGVQHFRYGADEFGVMSNPEADAMDALRVERAQQERQSRSEQEQKEKQLKTLEETYYALRMQNDPRAEQIKQQLDILSGRVSPPTATPQQIPPTSAFARPPYVAPESAPGPAAGPRRQPTPTPVETPAIPGLPGLMGPQIDPDRLMARQGQQTIAAALERGAQPTPEEIKARGGIDALMKEMIDARKAEEQRLASQSELRAQEAKARYERPFLQDPMALGELIGGMRGAKTFYEGITGAATAGGKAQGAREQAMRQAEEKLDLSRKEIFGLSNLRQQVQLDQAKLAEARASGDAQRSVNAAMKLGESQQKLAEFEANISDKAAGRRLQEEGIQVQREQIKSAERISELNRNAQAALRNLPGPEQQMVERAIKSLQDANPGMPYHEAYDKVRGAGKGLEERAEAARAKNATARQKLLNENMTYFSAQNTYISATDPAKKAEALRKMKEIERLNGIIDETAAAPAGGAVDKSNPLLK